MTSVRSNKAIDHSFVGRFTAKLAEYDAIPDIEGLQMSRLGTSQLWQSARVRS